MMPDLPLLLMHNLAIDGESRRGTSFVVLKLQDFSEPAQENWQRHISTTSENKS